jgi:predicted nucleotidyltransferase
MATLLPNDFKEFLTLLNAHGVEYLLVGGYAVGYYGYPRATNDIDIWIAVDQNNAERVVAVVKEFGFETPELSASLFLVERNVVRMGLPPMRIELLTAIDGVKFAECYPKRVVDSIDDIEVSIISLEHLKINKKAAGRHKDLGDLENLP